MNEYKLVLKLRQYTPLLHFQGSEAGACLRASEVKPKLDRFVLNYLEQQGTAVPESWILKSPESTGEGDSEGTVRYPALRYKMRFTTENDGRETAIHHLYFAGNMTGTAKSIFYDDGIQMTIVSLDRQRLKGCLRLYHQKVLEEPTLLELLKELLPAFFALHGFGTRSNKGFGSFGVEGKAVSATELRQCMPQGCLAVFDLASSTENYGMFERLDDVYVLSAMMKGGINLSFARKPAYYKGDIQTLLPANRMGSEKAYLKQRVFTEADKKWYLSLCRERRHEPEYHQYQFIRAMLGLTDTYTFGVGRNARKFTVKDVSGTIERFANPIVFRPYENGILVLANKIPDRMLGAKFQFKDSDHVISTPEKFDVVAFTSDFLRQLNGKVKNPFWNQFYHADASIKINGKDIYFRDTLDTLQLVEEGGN